MQKSRNFKRIILMVTIVAMIAVSVPMVSYGDEQPETIKKEYIITSSGDLSGRSPVSEQHVAALA